MAAINTLGVDHLSLRGTGDEYNRFSRYFKTRAEAEAALASGDWTPVGGVANACLTNDEGVLAYDQATNTLVNADEATREYINTQITNLVGDAPAVLDQLGELSDALGDDANFITTINDRITTESARVDSLIATDMWLFADQASFPDAGFNHGRVVHSHADGAMFYAHGGMWHKIENEAEAEAARAVIQADVDLNQNNAEAAIAALQGDVDKIELDSDAAEAALSGRLDVLEADPTTATALAAVQSDVDQNEVDSDAADVALGIRIDSVEAEIDTARTNIYTALGQSESATTMGTFTGSTLGDNQTVKELFQKLETSTEGEISARTAVAEFVSNITKLKNELRGTYLNLGNNIELRPAAGGRVEITGDIRLDNNSDLINGSDTVLTSFESINTFDGRITVLEADPVTKSYVDGTTSAEAAARVASDEALESRLDVLEADPTTAAAVAVVQADVDQNESDADAAIAVERGRIDAILDAADADKDTFAEIVTLINSVDTTNDNAFAGYVTSNDAAVAAVQADVDQNEADADAAIAAVQADVDQNESDGDAADAALGGRIDAVETEIDTARTNIYNAIGQAEGATTMGTFTGSTLGDGQTIKQLLQTLETSTEGEITARTSIAEFVSNITKLKNDLRGTYINVGNNIELRASAGGRVEIVGDLYLDNNTVINGSGTTLTSFENINAYDGRLNTLEADPTTATAVAAVQADVDQNEADADAADTALSDRLDVLEADPVTKTYVDTEVANLIDAAPGALDTLNELAASIGDDSNFVATVTNQIAVVQADVDQNESDADAAIALKANIADPTFTGTVTIPTLDVNTAITTPDLTIDAGGDDAIIKFTLETDGGSDKGGLVWNRNSGGVDIGAITYHRSLDSIRFYTNGTTNFDVEIGSGGELNAQNGLAIGGTSITSTAAELNFVDGVTSSIQDQLDAIQADVDQNESDADASISANEVHLDNLVSLSGVAKDQIHLSTFTGSTIVDNRTVKAALQDLETAVETKLDSSSVSTFGGTLVDDADAAAARTTLGLGSAATTDSGDYATAAQGATADAALPAAGAQAALSVDHLITLSGVAEAADDLGTFTGSTIDDNVTVKAALQALETAQEATQADVDQNESDADAAIAAVLAGTSIPGPYNNDTDAATGGVAVGAIYKNSNGTIHWRVS